MSAPHLTVVGVTESGADALDTAARDAIAAADTVFGGERHFALLAEVIGDRKRVAWRQPLADSFEGLDELAGQTVVVLASGEPLWHGIANTLIRRYGTDSVRVLPAVGAFSFAAAQLGWPLEQVHCRSLHGHALSLLSSWCYPGARLLLLTSGATAPREIADTLQSFGLGDTRVRVFEHLGGPDCVSGYWKTTEAVAEQHAALNLVALEVPVSAVPRALGVAPGLPDAAFVHDGQLTKRAVRAMTLARLRPLPGQVLWDLGAGCGSVAIEWSRLSLGLSAGTPAADAVLAHAVELNADRVAMLEQNRIALGTPCVSVHSMGIEAALNSLPSPHAVFIGGGLCQWRGESAGGDALSNGLTLIARCRDALLPGGRLVVNAVTLESEAVLLAACSKFGGELERVSVSSAQTVGRFNALQPGMPVLQYSLEQAST